MTYQTISNNGHTLKEEKETYSLPDTEIRFGHWHGMRYATFPRAFRKHKWMFRHILHANERELIIDLWSFAGEQGIFPSLEKLSFETGYSISRLCQLLNVIKEKRVVCLVCGYSSIILEIDKKIYQGSVSSNSYNLNKFNNFLEHVDKEHFKDDVKLKDSQGNKKPKETVEQEKATLEEFRKPYQEARMKNKKYKSFPKKKDDLVKSLITDEEDF